MGVLECARIVLYLVEWIWTTVVMGIFPNQMKEKVEFGNGSSSDACLFNLRVGLSRCNFGIAWGAIAFVVLTSTIIWYCLEYCSTIQLPGNVETTVFSWLAIWWFVGSIVLTATKSSRAPSTANVPVVFAWMLFILSAISAFIGSRGPKQRDYRISETENDGEGSEEYENL